MNYETYKPWEEELDEYLYEDRGVQCRIKRNMFGALCGYIGVKEDHPLFGCGEEDLYPYFRVHGGITFAGMFSFDQDNWYFGFDCGHAGDYQPKMMFRIHDHEVYRDVNYVKEEIKSMVDALHRHHCEFGRVETI
jgi:hypothetical protein